MTVFFGTDIHTCYRVCHTFGIKKTNFHIVSRLSPCILLKLLSAEVIPENHRKVTSCVIPFCHKPNNYTIFIDLLSNKITLF